MIFRIITYSFLAYLIYFMVNWFFYKTSKSEKCNDYSSDCPMISVLIPVRNEEKIIGEALNAALESKYPNFEVIVLNDRSTDKTAEILSKFDDQRLSVLLGNPLPKNWIGKNWACHQLSLKASGEIFLFLDADAILAKNGLALLSKKMIKTDADILSGTPKQNVKTIGEMLMVPFTGFVACGILPHFLLRAKNIGWAAQAKGQFMSFKRTAFIECGGFKQIYNEIADDVALPRLLKSKGKKCVYTDVTKLCESRMCTSFSQAFKSYSKSFYPCMREIPQVAIIVSLAIFLYFLSPYLLLMIDINVFSIVSLIFSLVIYLLSCLVIKTNVLACFFHPIVGFVFLAILFDSLKSYKKGSYEWNGRLYKSEEV